MLLTFVSGAQAQVQEVIDSRDWLMRMDHSVEYLNYEGTLVHIRDGRADTFRIYHRVDGDLITERLVALEGSGTEIIRNQDEVMCIFPDRQAVVVGQRHSKDKGQSPLRGNLPSYTETVAMYYDASLGPVERVAGRAAQVVDILPMDNFRYGYRLWLDQETAMPLKSQLRSEEDDATVEEILFADINFVETVAEVNLITGLDTTAFSWVHAGESSSALAEPDEETQWRATELPAGFSLAATHLEQMSDEEMPRIHLVYMDGLASVSVFVDAGVAASEQAEGWSQVGVANAYSASREGRLVTAVGQVPIRTVQSIALSVRSHPDPVH
ncbi:MAG: MucB/RseB C-terminal domain-containing protein [Gammaproteobacteria bacterium]